MKLPISYQILVELHNKCDIFYDEYINIKHIKFLSKDKSYLYKQLQDLQKIGLIKIIHEDNTSYIILTSTGEDIASSLKYVIEKINSLK